MPTHLNALTNMEVLSMNAATKRKRRLAFVAVACVLVLGGLAQRFADDPGLKAANSMRS
jgi:hypothetical protein